ncbi:hypothetical protein JXC34_01005, partial [Candidatus Woesearchaeota archaeon]|nr:hypothetical protein [Candidatus Woesearchaeota archaeon]
KEHLLNHGYSKEDVESAFLAIDKQTAPKVDSKEKKQQKVPQELLDYINSLNKIGHREKDIKDHLVQHGYDNETIETAFAMLPVQKKPEKQAHHSKINHVFYFLIALTVIALVVYSLMYFKFPSLGPDACDDVSVSIYEIESVPVLCVFPDNSKIQMIVQNTGSKTLYGVDITAKGSRSVKADIDEFNLPPGEFFTKVFDYGADNGDLVEVSLVPSVFIDNNKHVCASKKITLTGIETCK